MYSTDNGAEVMSWPDGGTTPFRGEKDTNWEGGWRVPCAIRWPGVIKPGTVSNEIFSHTDMLPTLLAAAGEPDIVEKLKKGYKVGQQDLQGPHRRLQPAAVPERRGERESPRKGFLYWSDDGDLMALRVRQLEGASSWSSAPTASASGRSRSSTARPEDLQPAERSVRARRQERPMFYDKWMVDRVFLLVPAQAIVGEFRQDASRSSRRARSRPASASTRSWRS